MGRFSKGFMIFAGGTVFLAVLVISLGLFVWKDSEELKPVAEVEVIKQRPVIIQKAPVEETKTIVTPAEQVSEDDGVYIGIMPSKISGTVEEEVQKVFAISERQPNLPEPLEIIEPISSLKEVKGSTYYPKIAKNGDEAWKIYARPVSEEMQAKPKIAVVVYGLGMKEIETDIAITRLPPDVTLSFSPYAENLAEQVAKARRYGHEVLVDMPMQDKDFPKIDGGPYTLLKDANLVQVEQKVRNVLRNSGAFVGVTALGGEALLDNKELTDWIYKSIFNRGLLFLETEEEAFFPAIYAGKGAYIKSNLMVKDVFKEALTDDWEKMEKRAKAHGSAVMLFPPFIAAMDGIVNWYEARKAALQTDIVLAPLTALVKVKVKENDESKS